MKINIKLNEKRKVVDHIIMIIQTKLACVSCGPRLLPSPANTLSLDNVSFPNISSNMDRGGVSIKIYKQGCRFKTTLYTIMVVPGGVYSKLLPSMPEKDQESGSENSLLEYYVFYYQAFYEQYRRTFQEQGKKIQKLHFRSTDDMTKCFKLFLYSSQQPYSTKTISFQNLSPFPSSSGAYKKKEMCSAEFINTATSTVVLRKKTGVRNKTKIKIHQ